MSQHFNTAQASKLWQDFINQYKQYIDMKLQLKTMVVTQTQLLPSKNNFSKSRR